MGVRFHALANIQSNMKFLVLAACVAVSTASLVTHPNGAVVPADEPAVALARAAHLSTKGFAYGAYPYAYGLNAAYPYAHAGAYPYAYAAGAYPYAHAGAYAYGAYPYAYGYPQALVAHANGAVVPADEPAVVAAKADHFAAHGFPYAAGVYAGLPYAGLTYAGLVAHPNGAVVPAEPADVVAARAEHLKAHAEA